ncbi:MAG TPA: arginine repressor [Actinomycetota bacterium]
MTGTKAIRHRRIIEVLRTHEVASQGELARLLRRDGQRVTQATLSRDLEELGAYKARHPAGGVAYVVPEEPHQAGEHLTRMLREFVTGVDASGSLAVLRTPPGCAQAVARAIDTTGVAGILATVAGDDTVLVVGRERVQGKTIARRLEAIASGTSREA